MSPSHGHPAIDPALLQHEVEAALANSRLSLLFQTRDPDRANAFLSGVYGPHVLRLGGARSCDMRLRGGEIAQLHLGELRYGTPAQVASGRVPGHWVFSYVRCGEVWRGDKRQRFGAGDAGVTAPDDVHGLDMSADMELLNLRVERAAMWDACKALLGTDLTHNLGFAPRTSAGSVERAALLRVLGHLAATPAYAHSAGRRLDSRLREAALYELLLAWPNSYTRSLDTPAALPRSTGRGRDYIHAHAADAPCVSEIARAAGVGVRSLARGFHKHLGVSPQRYLQQIRLDQVRQQLRTAAEQGDTDATVTDIAAQWGFWQLGAFAARYRERFGESPSQTLRGQRQKSDSR